jgi:NAD(P)H-dependent FMN reductase
MSPRVLQDFVAPNQVSLPIFDQDDEGDPEIIRQVRALHARFSAADALVVASPEYNGQLTAYLKNTIDWVSRLAYIDESIENPFLDRPLLLCSASTGGSGGAVGIASARAMFGHVGCMVLGETICVPHVESAWTGSGFMFDPQFETWLAGTVRKLLDIATATNRTRRPHATPVMALRAGAAPNTFGEFADGASALA